MRVNLNLLVIFGILSVLIACNEEEEEKSVDFSYGDEDDELYEFESFALNNYELPFFIYLPDETADIGTSTKPIVEHQLADYKWKVKLGQRFVIEIVDMGEMHGVEDKKEELEDLSHIFDVEYIEKEDDFIYYKRTVKQSSDDGVGVDHITYHCYANHVFDGINYLVGSHEDGVPKPIAEYMKISVRNVEQAR